jgi:tetratricopeptide (TPR) repeat protein
MTRHLSIIGLFASVAGAVFAQSTPTGSPTDTTTGGSTYIPGTTYQEANPNYPIRNPFYFEGRIDWNLLKITQPSTTWEYMERGIHKQDDLEDYTGAIADYQQSIAMNNVGNKTCQLVTTAPPATGKLDPAPCIFTVRLRLAGLLRSSSPKDAISFYQQALDIDPLRLGVHAAIAETYVAMAGQATDQTTVPGLYQQAVTEYIAELALSPVTPLQTQVTGDTANNAHVHWELAEVYEKLNQLSDEISELNLYLQATKWHSDTYPWRIQLAQKRIAKAQAKKNN